MSATDYCTNPVHDNSQEQQADTSYIDANAVLLIGINKLFDCMSRTSVSDSFTLGLLISLGYPSAHHGPSHAALQAYQHSHRCVSV